MLSFLKQSFERFRRSYRGEPGAGPLIDSEEVEAMLERSRVPAVLMLVLVWTVSAVVLILSGVRQYRLEDWEEGQRAPFSIYAAVDFQYVDPAETARRIKEARESVPGYYRLDDEKTRRILKDVDDFFSWVGSPADDKSAAPKYKLTPELKKLLVEAKDSERGYREFRENLRMMLNRGINRSDIGGEWRVVGKNGAFTAQRSDTVDQCADTLARRLLPGSFESNHAELKKLLKDLIGADGNLSYYASLTDAERQKAETAVKPVRNDKEKGALLIRKGDRYTREIREIIEAERKAMPGSGRLVAYRQVAWSFFVLLGGVLFIYRFSKDIRRDNLRIILAGITIAVGLALNYNAIKFFEYLLQILDSMDNRLIIAAVPVAFTSVVLSLSLDLRTALCAGGIVAVISSMMIMPHRSLELALRWVAISSAAALAVHHVSNYRSFFERTVLTVLGMTAALSIDAVFWGHTAAELPLVIKHAAWTILGNAVAGAMLALLMIFVLERVFNLSTDTVLMGLSDCTHVVLGKLQREAGGTMAHSMAVATLAEDAARAIGANPLRAKVGALFHDIGKLVRPQYFTENNPDSALLHDRLKPEESARIILAHVTDGVAMAREHRLCRFVRNVIATHHGDDLVRFFYYKAQEESKKTGIPVREADFRYTGKPPRSREEGIISLADACEAASRSLKDPTEESLAALVGNIIQGRFRDGLLRDSRLSAAELEVLRKSFISTLSSMMRGRIAYPAGATASGEAKKC